MCHNHDYHPCEGEKMEKELPELPQGIATRAKGYTFDQFEKDVEEGIMAIVEHIKELGTQHNKDRWQLEIENRFASVEERVERGLALASIAPGWEKEARGRLSALEFLHGKIEPTFLHKHDETDHYCAPAPSISIAVNPSCPPDEIHFEQDGEIKGKIVNIALAPGEAWLRVKKNLGMFFYRLDNGDTADLIREEFVDPADLVKEPPADVMTTMLSRVEAWKERAEAAERRLQEAVKEAGEWFNKENGYLLGVMAEQEFNVWLARYGDKGGEK